jgi:hypothetical protein
MRAAQVPLPVLSPSTAQSDDALKIVGQSAKDHAD